jgi:glyoxylase-like metal-dependent hydrolase (beta-lactamase superfamily II)
MNSKHVGNRGYLFTFKEPYKTNVYIINGKKFTFILDTFLGSNPMDSIMNFLIEKDEKIKKKTKLVFNSHYDYDHVWGNSYFKNSIIFSHFLCRKILDKEGRDSLTTYENHKRGKVELILPNMTFLNELNFDEDKINFFSSPGHTEDSASCYDSIDKVLFVGDNIEFPFPYIRVIEIDKYINTLNAYLDYNIEYLITGHTDLIRGKEKILKVIKQQLNYVKNFKQKRVDLKNLTDTEKLIHYSNLKGYGNILKSNNFSQKSRFYYEEAIDLLHLMPDDTKGKEKALNDLKKVLKMINNQ